ncbi:NAD(P)H-dependent flavin oxidoreductase [Mycolicibacter longobardus]|uniref:2-nitropropane dioxygenase n=1 Tax=Mycolicibacter longobardus TaxID=1108812 RepID=A0A1X1YPN5_9MYCO|nr:nitronate monooxygenase [Mycolicibacter longobardus]MCV7384322.1 nitronate monooxygenase [Mycolicibacter longobardus]ORW13003.1 2-nitropropane dioxygenase [Mycolicibacter longobardus]
MGGVAGGRLAAAVTAAGGLGMIGMGSTATAASLATELAALEQAPRFGIGLVDWVIRDRPDLLDAALAARPALLSVSFGADLTWVDRAHAAGILAATQVYDAETARRAQDAGLDVLVARGAEGGGHGDTRLATLPLLDAVLDAVTVPVLAAGGIGSPRSLAAVLAAGAAGAWLGTCLSACPEALTADSARRALIAAAGTDTVTTRVFDVGQRLDWPARFPSRVLRNEFTGRWMGHEETLAGDPEAAAELAAGIAAGDQRVAPVDAGQGVGVLTDSRPAGVVLDELCTGAQRLLARWS